MESLLRRRMRPALLALTALSVLVALTAMPAGASPRGINGQISYDRFIDFEGDQAVFIANPDGGQEQQIVPAGCCPSWSHDGTKLATPYLTDDERIGTATVNADGAGYNPLPINHPTLNVGCAGGAWSPDDTQLACESWDDSNPDLNGIYTISPVDGSGLTRVTANPLGGHDIPGAYSPNGKQIVFVRFNATDFFGIGLFVVKTNTGQLRQITSAGGSLNIGADWSPQGNEIIFSRHVTDDVAGSIWVVHPDGSGLHEIQIQGLTCGSSFVDPTGFGCHAPRWSPDGKKIIFAAESFLTGVNIYTANADGSGLAQITQDGGSDDPAWGTHPPIG